MFEQQINTDGRFIYYRIDISRNRIIDINSNLFCRLNEKRESLSIKCEKFEAITTFLDELSILNLREIDYNNRRNYKSAVFLHKITRHLEKLLQK